MNSQKNELTLHVAASGPLIIGQDDVSVLHSIELLSTIHKIATEVSPGIEAAFSTQLAKGADRILSKAALDAGWILKPITPGVKESLDGPTSQPDELLETLWAAAKKHEDYPHVVDAENHARLVGDDYKAQRHANYKEASRRIIGKADLLIAILDLNIKDTSQEKVASQETGVSTKEAIYLALTYDVRTIWVDKNEERNPQCYWVDMRPQAFLAIMQLPKQSCAETLRELCRKVSLDGTQDGEGTLKEHVNRSIQARAALEYSKAKIRSSEGSFLEPIAKFWSKSFDWQFTPTSSDEVKRVKNIIHSAESRTAGSQSSLWSFTRIDFAVIGRVTAFAFRERKPKPPSTGTAAKSNQQPSSPLPEELTNQQPSSPLPEELMKVFEIARKKGKDGSLSNAATHYQGLHRASFLATTLFILCFALSQIVIVMIYRATSHQLSHPAGNAHSSVSPVDKSTSDLDVQDSTANTPTNPPSNAANDASIDHVVPIVSSPGAVTTPTPPISSANATRSNELPSTAVILLEFIGLLFLLAALVVFYVARTRQWNAFATDFRVISERLRHAPVLMMIGEDPAAYAEQLPHYAEYNPLKTWIGTAYRETVVEILDSHPKFLIANLKTKFDTDRDYRHECGIQIVKWLETQRLWLEKTALAYEQAVLLTEHLQRLLLVIAIIAHVALVIVGWEFSIFFALFLPPICIAIFSIVSQAELARMASRYKSLAIVLAGLREKIEIINSYSDSSGNNVVLREYTIEALKAALAEAFEWRLLHRYHPIHSPI